MKTWEQEFSVFLIAAFAPANDGKSKLCDTRFTSSTQLFLFTVGLVAVFAPLPNSLLTALNRLVTVEEPPTS